MCRIKPDLDLPPDEGAWPRQAWLHLLTNSGPSAAKDVRRTLTKLTTSQSHIIFVITLMKAHLHATLAAFLDRLFHLSIIFNS